MSNKLQQLTPAQSEKFNSYLNTKEESGRTPLFLAADADRQKCALVLLQYGASTEEPDLHKVTPIGAAVRKGHAEMIKILLKYNANANVTIDGKTLVEIANARIGDITEKAEIIQLLLAHGCVVSDDVIDQIIADNDESHREELRNAIQLARVTRARKYTNILSSFAPLPASDDPKQTSPMDIISQFTSFENPFD